MIIIWPPKYAVKSAVDREIIKEQAKKNGITIPVYNGGKPNMAQDEKGEI